MSEVPNRVESKYEPKCCSKPPENSSTSPQLQNHRWYKTGTSQQLLNVEDGLCSQQNSDVFLSASLHFLQNFLERRLDILKSENSLSHKTNSNSNASDDYSCGHGQAMACLNGTSLPRQCPISRTNQDPLEILPATRYQDKVITWASSCRNPLYDCVGSCTNAKNTALNITNTPHSIQDAKTKCNGTYYGQSACLHDQGEQNTTSLTIGNEEVNNALNSMNKTHSSTCEIMSNGIYNKINKNDIHQLQQITFACGDHQSETIKVSENTVSQLGNTSNWEPDSMPFQKKEQIINQNVTTPPQSKFPAAIFQFLRTRSKSHCDKGSAHKETCLHRNSVENSTITASLEKCSTMSPNACRTSEVETNLPLPLKSNKDNSRVETNKCCHTQKLSPGTIARLQTAILSLFGSNKHFEYSDHTNIITDKRKNKHSKAKMSSESSCSCEEKRTAFSQTSQIFISANTESRTSNSFISITESGIERLLTENCVNPHCASSSEDLNIRRSTDLSLTFNIAQRSLKLASLRIYRLPQTVACRKCKKVAASHRGKYKDVATSTDDVCVSYSPITGCPYCSHCYSVTEEKNTAYLSNTLSRTFEAKLGSRTDAQVKTSFNLKSGVSSTTVFTERLRNGSYFKSNALSRIMKHIVSEQSSREWKSVFNPDIPRETSSLVAKPRTNRRMKTRLFRQLSKLSVCDDNDLEITKSDCSVASRPGLQTKVSPGLSFVPDGTLSRTVAAGEKNGDGEYLHNPENSTAPGCSPTQSLNITIREQSNLCGTSTCNSPPEFVSVPKRAPKL